MTAKASDARFYTVCPPQTMAEVAAPVDAATMPPPPPVVGTTRPLDAVEDPEARKRRRREKLGGVDLSNYTVEGFLTLSRDNLVAELDTLTGKLVQDLHEECAKAKESLRAEFAPGAAKTGPRKVVMEATSGPHAGITYTLTVGTGACFVGRSSGKKFREKGISLSKDNEVSTTHAKIELQRDEVVLVDVGSTNGTTLDGESIEEAKPYPLKAGSNVIFGGSAFTVHSIDALN